MRIQTVWLLTTLLAAPSIRAQSSLQSVTLSPSRDNTLYGSPSERSNGAGTRMFVGRTIGGQIRRAILGFDVAAAIPAGATVTAVTFEITERQNQFSGTSTMSLHRVQQDWIEGVAVSGGGQGGGAPANPGDVTFSSASLGSVLWAAPGGDFDAAASGSAMVTFGSGGGLIPSSSGLVADVQGWLDTPTSNFGWIVKTHEAPGPLVSAFGAREGNDPARIAVSFTSNATASTVRFGAGCGGPFGSSVLSIDGFGLPEIGNNQFGLQVIGGSQIPTPRPVLLSFGGVPGGLPLPSGTGACSLFVDLALLAVAIEPDAGGFVALPIPNDPNLAGLVAFVQAIKYELGFSLISSNGLEIRLDL